MKHACVLVMLFVAVSAFAATPPEPGALEGVVTDFEFPAASVRVTAATADRVVFTATTDAAGRFVFRALPAGPIMIVATRTVSIGTQTIRAMVRVEPSRTAKLQLALPIPVENQCTCSCPYDQRQTWSVHYGCTDCNDCGGRAEQKSRAARSD